MAVTLPKGTLVSVSPLPRVMLATVICGRYGSTVSIEYVPAPTDGTW